MNDDISRRVVAEFFGTFWLVLGRMRRRGPGRGLSEPGDRLSRRRVGFRLDRADHGLCRRPYLRRPSQPGGHGRPVERRALLQQARHSLYRRPGHRRHRRRRRAVSDRIGQARLESPAGLPPTATASSAPAITVCRRLLGERSGDDVLLPVRHHGHDVQGRRGRFRRHCHRSRP